MGIFMGCLLLFISGFAFGVWVVRTYDDYKNIK